MTIKMHSATSKDSTTTVADEIFGQKVNKQLLSQAIRVYLSNKRQGTNKVKTRSENSRSKSKWYKQKGTGNARHGSRNAPIFVGGGIAHGPKGMTDWSLKLTSRMKKQALISAFSGQAENIVVTAQLRNLSGKTSEGQRIINFLAKDANKVLVIINTTQPQIIRSLANLGNVLITKASRVTALEVAMADQIILEKDAIKVLEERLMGNSEARNQEPENQKTNKKEESVEKENSPAGEKKVTKTAVKKAPVKKVTKKKATAKE